MRFLSALPSRGRGVFIKVRGQRPMLGAFHLVEWSLLIGLGQTAKPSFETNRARRTKHTTMLTGVCGEELSWAPEISSLIQK